MKVNIPEEIVSVLKKRVEETGEFDDVEEYIKYLLEQVVERLEESQEDTEFTEEDEKKIEERLRGLGYLG